MAPVTADARFSRLHTDPRFRRPKQKDLKVEIDERFRDVLDSEEFGASSSGKRALQVDKRGRRVAPSQHADQLKRFYRVRTPSPTASSSKDVESVDYARGQGALSSSGSEDEAGDDVESEVEEEELELGQTKRRLPGLGDDDESDSNSESQGSQLEIDLSEEDDPSPPDMGDSDEEQEFVTATKRIAAVNLDWDNLRAGDLFVAFNSFLKATSAEQGKLMHVRIYPSEFGKGRMEREEAEGPGGGIFLGKSGQKQKDRRKERLVRHEDREDDDEGDLGASSLGHSLEHDEEDMAASDDDQEDGRSNENPREVDADEDGLDDDHVTREIGNSAEEIDGLEIVTDVSSEAAEDDIDMDQLRQYQLERLRYYYAIAEFSTVEAARHVMDECNGTEYERTANVMDLSYVPDDMEFANDEIKDEAKKELKGYKGNDFVTGALRHSKVQLTWDQDDPNRTKVTRRNLTKEEIEEEDFKAFVASSDSEDADDSFRPAEAMPAASSGNPEKQSKKQALKQRTEQLRSLLLAGEQEEDDVWGKGGSTWQDELVPKKSSKATDRDMEITFRPGLSASQKLDGGDEEHLTTLEKYQMRMKERKARKKEKMEMKRVTTRDGLDESAQAVQGKDDFFGDDSGSDNGRQKLVTPPAKQPIPEDLGDVGGGGGGVEHFSIKDIIKAEKADSKKRKRKRPGKGLKNIENEREIELGPSDWKMDVRDRRFTALHEEPEFAIDPSNPHFTKTKAMKEMLAERARLRVKKGTNLPMEVPRSIGAVQRNPGEKDLHSLVESVKRKMNRDQGRARKRSRR